MGFGAYHSSQGQATGQSQKDQSALAQIVKELQQIKDEAKLDETLAKLVIERKITKDQAARFKEQWRKR